LNGVRGGRAVVASSTCGSRPAIALRNRPTAFETPGPPGSAVTPGSSVTFGSVVGIERSARSGWRGTPSMPRPSSSRSFGMRVRRGVSAAGGSSRPSGLGSSSTLRMSRQRSSTVSLPPGALDGS
jgi:hypothetical protein